MKKVLVVVKHKVPIMWQENDNFIEILEENECKLPVTNEKIQDTVFP